MNTFTVGINSKPELGGETLYLTLSRDALKVFAFGGYGRDDDGELIEIDTDYLVHSVELSDKDTEALDNGEYVLTIPQLNLDKLADYRREYTLGESSPDFGSAYHATWGNLQHRG